MNLAAKFFPKELETKPARRRGLGRNPRGLLFWFFGGGYCCILL